MVTPKQMVLRMVTNCMLINFCCILSIMIINNTKNKDKYGCTVFP